MQVDCVGSNPHHHTQRFEPQTCVDVRRVYMYRKGKLELFVTLWKAALQIFLSGSVSPRVFSAWNPACEIDLRPASGLSTLMYRVPQPCPLFFPEFCRCMSILSTIVVFDPSSHICYSVLRVSAGFKRTFFTLSPVLCPVKLHSRMASGLFSTPSFGGSIFFLGAPSGTLVLDVWNFLIRCWDGSLRDGRDCCISEGGHLAERERSDGAVFFLHSLVRLVQREFSLEPFFPVLGHDVA